MVNFTTDACRIASRLKWYKNYKNRLRLGKVIVKNKMSRFYGSLCINQVQRRLSTLMETKALALRQTMDHADKKLIQPVVWPVEQAVECLYTRHNRLSCRQTFNSCTNSTCLIHATQHSAVHMQPVVQPVEQPVSQPVASCKQGLRVRCLRASGAVYTAAPRFYNPGRPYFHFDWAKQMFTYIYDRPG